MKIELIVVNLNYMLVWQKINYLLLIYITKSCPIANLNGILICEFLFNSKFNLVKKFKLIQINYNLPYNYLNDIIKKCYIEVTLYRVIEMLYFNKYNNNFKLKKYL